MRTMQNNIEVVPLAFERFYGWDGRAHAFVRPFVDASGQRLGELVTQVGPAMESVIGRYGLRDQRVISVGAGRAHEEFHLVRAGCRVDLLDRLDEYGPAIRERIDAARSGVATTLRYLIADLAAVVSATASDMPDMHAAYDLCHVSSFAPDELDREAVLASYRRRRTRDEAYASYQSWPEGMPPFLQMVMDTNRLLAPGGLFLLQSYRGGVDLVQNPHYPRLILEQLARNDMILLEIHYFLRSPAIQLVAAVKGAEHVAGWRERLAARSALTEFHGRYPDAGMRREISWWAPG